MRARLPGIAAGVLAAFFAWALARFTSQGVLSSFADDSVSYLVMAQVFSPWQAASAPVVEAFAREAYYPPLYPALLALAGAAHDFATAQALTALLVAACLPLVYRLAADWLGERWPALAATALVALLPTMWIHAKGMLSEPLFCLLLLATLLAARPGPAGPRSRTLAVLFAALALTRAVGIAASIAFAAWALAQPGTLAARARRAAPALAGPLAYLAWVVLRPAHISDDYGRIFSEQASGGASFALAVLHDIGRQASAIAEAWVAAVLLFWVEGRPLRVALAAAIGLLALAGMALRWRKPDAWIVAAYIAVFLVWPFYDQMTRFIFPAVPALLLYAFVAAARVAARLGRPAVIAHGLLGLLVLSLALPGMGFIRSRAAAGGPLAYITDWYRTPSLAEARRRAQVHLDLMEDMRLIRDTAAPAERVMWVVPSYIALIAGRHAVRAPHPGLSLPAYRSEVAASGAQYVLLSAYHPRDTIRETAWHAGVRAMLGQGEIVHTRADPDGGRVSSLLIRLPAAGAQRATIAP